MKTCKKGGKKLQTDHHFTQLCRLCLLGKTLEMNKQTNKIQWQGYTHNRLLKYY